MSERDLTDRLIALRREVEALRDRQRQRTRDHAQLQEYARLHFEKQVLERQLAHDPHFW